MSGPIDGGPAFPVVMDESFVEAYNGMNLRDWFAGMALPKVMEELYFYSRKACTEDVKADEITWFEAYNQTDADTLADKTEEVAFACYRFADAMLAARKP